MDVCGGGGLQVVLRFNLAESKRWMLMVHAEGEGTEGTRFEGGCLGARRRSPRRRAWDTHPAYHRTVHHRDPPSKKEPPTLGLPAFAWLHWLDLLPLRRVCGSKQPEASQPALPYSLLIDHPQRAQRRTCVRDRGRYICIFLTR